GVVHLNLYAQLLGSSIDALHEAIAVTVTSSVGAAAAAGEAQLGVAFLHGSVAGQVAALLFLEVNARHIGTAHRPAVNEHELDIGELLGGLRQSLFLHKACADNHFSAVLGSQLHGVVTVVVGGLIAAGGLIVLVGLAGLGSVQLHAVIGALVEGLVLQLAYVGNESNLILAILGGHLVGDVVGAQRGSLSGLGAVAALGGLTFRSRGRIGSLGGVIVVCGCTTGEQTDNHQSSQQKCQNLLHLIFLHFLCSRCR